MSNLIEIQSQIERLQKQASEIKAREFDNTVLDILSKMTAFGISFKDLQAGLKRGSRSKPKVVRAMNADRGKGKLKVVKSKAQVAPKFRGPNGETWSGRGLTPRWLSTLIAQGQTKESFAIKS